MQWQLRMRANDYWHIGGLCGYAIDGDSGGGAGGIVEREDVSSGAAAFKRHHRFLPIWVVAENNESADVAAGGELS